jgi:hypothetical protein
MTPKHRQEPLGAGGAIRRAVVTSVVSSLALTSVTITAAAVTLTNSPAPRPAPLTGAAPETASPPPDAPVDGDSPPAPPAQVKDLPVGIPDIELVVADGVRLDAVPDAAVAAYQRAAAVLGSADKQCQLRWTLVAAVGQVVSGHGSTGDSELGKHGVVRPKLTGDALRGRDGKRVPDSDAGRLDGDGRFDRAVGPMQLSPATWAVVGVDSDGDGRRNPHDIDDAALAVSVLLCSGKDDMRRRAGRIEAVRRVNDGKQFVESVLAVARTYRTQLSDLYDTVPVVVPSYPMPELPVAARGDLATDAPTDGPTTPTDPSDSPSMPTPNNPTPTTPVPAVPTPTVPPATHPPRDPENLPEPCPTEPSEPVVTDPTEPTEPAEPADPTDPTEPTETTTDEPTDVPEDEPTEPIGTPGCTDGTEPDAD